MSFLSILKDVYLISSCLLGQNPYGTSSKGVVEKVLIVCPVSLVNVLMTTNIFLDCFNHILSQNWKAEFHKWLGRDRVGVVTCDKDKKAALTFMNAYVTIPFR